MQSLNDLLVESKIFADREVLSPHYMPKKLLFREKEINNIEKALAPSLKGERGRNLFIYGKTGTGKTSCTKYVIDEVKNIPNTKARISYVNCRIYNSRLQGAQQDSQRPPAHICKAGVRRSRSVRKADQLDRRR